jgi:hypothetical protein
MLILGWAMSPPPAPAEEETLVWGCASAAYFGETREYAHGVLGDDIEYKGLYTTWFDSGRFVEARITLPDGQVFEDIAPRCADFDGDGAPDPVTVISDAQAGGRLALFVRGEAFVAPPIGRGNRWLAPFAIADMNGDGALDIAYVEKPHLSGRLMLWTLREDELENFAILPGFSNHRIGEDFITGGVRDCGSGPELVLPNFDWTRLMAVTFGEEGLQAVEIGSDTGRAAVAKALECGN